MFVLRVRRMVAATVLATGWLLGIAPAASAHAVLVSTVPTNGEHLVRAPAEVLLRFSEPVSLVRDGISLLDSQGKPAGAAHAEGVTAVGDEVQVPLAGGLPDGAYVVAWRVVSADSHPVHGAFVFSVGNARAAPVVDASAQGGADPWVNLAFWIFRLLSYVSLALLVGGAFFVTVCWPAGREDPRVGSLLRWSRFVAIGSAAAVYLLQGAAAAGTSVITAADPALLGQTLATGFGILVVLRIALLAAFPLILHRARGRAGAVAVLAAGAVLGFTWSGTGHSSVGSAAVFTAAADTAHLLAMAVWLGGLVVLAVFVLAGNKITVEDATEVSERFSRTALISVGVLIVSGVVIAVKELVGTPDLAGSRYAELLLFKLAAFGLLLCVATLSRAVVRARFQTSQPAQRVSRRRGEATKQAQQVRRLRRTVSGEVAIAGVVLAVAALLVATPPTERSVGPAPVAAHSGPYLDALALPSSGDVQVWVEPASAGDNQVAINVRDERGVNRDVPEVSAKLSLSARGVGPIPVPLTRTQAGQFVADRIAIPMAGEWHLEISVRTTDFDQSTVDTDVPVS